MRAGAPFARGCEGRQRVYTPSYTHTVQLNAVLAAAPLLGSDANDHPLLGVVVKRTLSTGFNPRSNVAGVAQTNPPIDPPVG